MLERLAIKWQCKCKWKICSNIRNHLSQTILKAVKISSQIVAMTVIIIQNSKVPLDLDKINKLIREETILVSMNRVKVSKLRVN